jgi:Protein of unknown function, DUF547
MQLIIPIIVTVTALCLSTVQAVCSLPYESAFTSLLNDHVKSGFVDYSRMKSDKRLAEIIKVISSVNHSTMKGNEKKAFFINVYNAFTLKLMCDSWPVKSIRDLGNEAVVGSITKTTPWDKRIVTLYDKTYTLNEIEHAILRPMGDPRIHYAIVCAAKSCPPLRSQAFMAAELDNQLDDQARIFIQSSTWNAVDVDQSKASISSIFSWFAADFGSTEQNVLLALARYLPADKAKHVRENAGRYRITYKDYDWSVNGR